MTPVISYFCRGREKTPDKTTVGRKGSFRLTVSGLSPLQWEAMAMGAWASYP